MPKYTFLVTVQQYRKAEEKWDIRRALLTCEGMNSNKAFRRCLKSTDTLTDMVEQITTKPFDSKEVAIVEECMLPEDELASLKTFTNVHLLAKHLAQMESL